MRNPMRLHAAMLVLACLLPAPALAGNGGTMALTINLRATPSEAVATVRRDESDRQRSEASALPATLVDGLQQVAGDLERKYPAADAAAIISRIRTELLVVSTESTPPRVLASTGDTEVLCAQPKCESL